MDILKLTVEAPKMERLLFVRAFHSVEALFVWPHTDHTPAALHVQLFFH